MREFSIDIRRHEAASADDPFGIRMGVGETIFTRLLRRGETDDYLKAPPAQLAFWLADNWWRLRWETIPTPKRPADWRVVHELSGIGGGYPWPRLSIWGDRDRIGFLSQSDPVGVVGPVRYLTDALLYTDAQEFEREVDRFLDEVADERTGFGSDRPALRALVAALREERSDADVARWRRLEACLGYNPDEGPSELIERLGNQADAWGQEAVEEAAMAAPGSDAARILANEVEAAKNQGVVCDFSDILSEVNVSRIRLDEPPWVIAERTAEAVRQVAGIKKGRLLNKRLSELLGVGSEVFRRDTSQSGHPYGLRLSAIRGETQRVLLRSGSTADRRFELCRALGDALWAKGEPMGPLAKSATVRQKFQRAFAQSLLCPFDALQDHLKTRNPDETNIRTAADYFHVSERVVQTTLVNKGMMDRERFEELLEAA